MKKRKNRTPDAVIDHHPFDIKLEGIKIIKEKIDIPEEFSYDTDRKKLEGTLHISLKIKNVDSNSTLSSTRELIEVLVCFNSYLSDVLIAEFEIANIFSISDNKLNKLLKKPNVKDSIISFIINNSIAQTRGIHQLKISNTKIHRISIPLVTLKDLKEMVHKGNQSLMKT